MTSDIAMVEAVRKFIQAHDAWALEPDNNAHGVGALDAVADLRECLAAQDAETAKSVKGWCRWCRTAHPCRCLIYK